jgi:hypothetical protein
MSAPADIAVRQWAFVVEDGLQTVCLPDGRIAVLMVAILSADTARAQARTLTVMAAQYSGQKSGQQASLQGAGSVGQALSTYFDGRYPA